MTQRPTSHDVARLAGVSQSTVSYVLSGRGRISASTRERVLAAVAELGYQPNLAARTMRTRRTGRLAVVLPAAAPSPNGLVAAAARVAVEAGYTLEIHAVIGEQEPATRHEVLRSGAFEGVLTFTSLTGDDGDDGAGAAGPSGVPVVSLADDFDDQMRVTGPLLGAAPIGQLVTELAALGHTRFLHLAGDPDFHSGRSRHDAYRRVVEELGLTDLGVHRCGWSGEAALRAVAGLGDDTPPVAIVAANDVLATAAVRACLARGWRVPQDVTVTGWDNHPTTAYQSPSLTTVDVDFAALGAWAMRRLVALVRAEAPPPELEGIQRIIWRESSGPPTPPTPR